MSYPLKIAMHASHGLSAIAELLYVVRHQHIHGHGAGAPRDVPVYSSVFVGIYCTYRWRDGQAELTCVAGYIPRCFIRPHMVNWSPILVLTGPDV